MLSYLRGRIVLKKENFVILETSGVGFKVFVSKKTLKEINEEELVLFSYLDVGERSLKLYGFLSHEELELFELVRNISGIGPKAALEICSIGPPEKIKTEILKGNEKILDNIPGIGPKKARKIILELSGKLKVPAREEPEEVFSALMNLGFRKEEIKKALKKLPEDLDTQEKITQTLKLLGK
jgi:Holliday junction DNA helicase RuvA